MTIAIRIKFRSYVLLAADTRITDFPPDGGLSNPDDNFEKIYYTGLGIITGAGIVDLLYLVNKRLREIPQNQSIRGSELLSIINFERLRLRRKLSPLSEKQIEAINNTGWMFSSLMLKNEIYSVGLGLIYPSSPGWRLEQLPDNTPFPFLPPEANEAQRREIIISLKNLTKPIDQFETIEESIQYHGLQIAGLIYGLSQNFESISADCQVGAHTLDSRTGISKVIKDGDSEVQISLSRKSM